jgi:CHAT domain-containing protein/tetratricopeptide (TPR) repeat protein
MSTRPWCAAVLALSALMQLSPMAAAPAPAAAPSPTAAAEPGKEASREESDPQRKAAQAAAEHAEKIRDKAPLPQVIQAEEEALRLWRKTGDRDEILEALGNLIFSKRIHGDLDGAEQLARGALKELEEEKGGEPGWRITFLGQLADLAGDRGENEKAIDYSSRAIALIPTEQSFRRALALDDKIPPLIELGRYSEAAEIAKEAMALSSAKENQWLQALVLQKLTVLAGSIGDTPQRDAALKALDELNDELAEDKRIDTKTLAQTYLMGECPNNSVLNSIANRRSSATEREAGGKGQRQPAEISPYSSVVTTYMTPSDIGQKERDTLLSSVRTRGDWGLELALIKGLSSNSDATGQPEKALEYALQQLAIAERVGAQDEVARGWFDLGRLHQRQSKPQQAIQALMKALSIQQRLGLKPDEIRTWNALAKTQIELGDLEGSLHYSQQALSLARKLGDIEGQTNSLLNIAFAHWKRNDPTQTQQSLKEAHALSISMNDCIMIASALADSARFYLDQKMLLEANKAISQYEQAATDVDKRYRAATRMAAAHLRALLLLQEKRHSRVIALAQEKLTQLGSEERGVFFLAISKAPLYNVLAKAHASLGQIPQAIAAHRQELAIFTAMAKQPERAQRLFDIAKLQRHQGDRQAALATINEGIAVVESIREQVADPDLRTSFSASYQDFYAFKIDLLLELEASQPGVGHAAEAFHTSERSRARTLLELLQEARADIRQGVDPALLEQEKTLQSRRIALDRRWKQAFSEAGDSRQLPQLKQERQQLLQEAELLRQKMRNSSPRYAALTDPQPLTLAQVQQQLLDPDTLLLQYALGPERSHLFVVSRDGLQVHTLPAAAEIEAQVKRLREPLATNQLPSEVEAISATISKTILHPAAAALATHKRLILVPDGALHLLPFSPLPIAAPDGTSRALLDSHQLLQLPSVSTLALLRQQNRNTRSTRTTSIAILADPIFSANDSRLQIVPAGHRAPAAATTMPSADLRQIASTRLAESLDDCDTSPPYCRLAYTAQEARHIHGLFAPHNASLAIGLDADYQRATDPRLANYSLLHFATHGVFNSKQPALSGLLLSRVDKNGNSKDGFLQLSDIFNLNLNADQVVLSACETGLGEQIKGEGMVGITRGFFYAGARRVLVSLWQVNDEATAVLMTSFYNALIQQKLPASLALQAAQQQVRQKPQWSHPYYWGAFVLQGEW